MLFFSFFWNICRPCGISFCSYQYTGLVDPDEVAVASSIALQAYFEGRPMNPADMEKCLEYWRNNISEMGDPEGRKRDVCCEPYAIPCFSCTKCYKCTHPQRDIPYGDDDERNTVELQEASLSCVLL